MPREQTGSLFGEPEERPDPAGPRPETPPNPSAPLADRMRPRSLDEFVGQEHLIGPGKLLRRLVEGSGRIPSMILWGPPGSGKTTLARLLSTRDRTRFEPVSAVLSGVKELREAIARAREARRHFIHTLLFVDEIHRFNKAQQDALLPSVEDGTVTLVGATTENPSFEVNAALLSRCRTVVLHPLDEGTIASLLRRALEDGERGLATLLPEVPEAELGRLARSSGGDVRVALSALEAAVLSSPPGEDGRRVVDEATVVEALGRSRYSYDKGGEDHYNLASALIKSLRNSDADAGLYWLARLIGGGADPVFIARRLCILASEDVGLADPMAMVQASSAAEITRLIGLPEALYPLAQATIYLARAPKSDLVKRAYHAASADADETAREPVPLHLRNAVTPTMKAAGYGRGYRYAHDDPAAREEMSCLPDRLRGRSYLDDPGAGPGPSGSAEEPGDP
ncbi:replication-associated recombination protein A [Tautonia plasticadhaerens]|uniref:Replication-associated recombination protein A n=1 Tax=Tautonia plasticadhaerens TaxID=2527974 RepID=A0A518H2E5_9BACT|nr:replication-associated recombination protein A [Tautonia plasticadhaerens]QDV35022.1 Replication-associated recombination protein A [Tautonia plasticadhaerens]